MTFAAYLEAKKIDPSAFAKAEPHRFHEWQSLFEQVHEASFTMQKKFLINPTRRRFPLSKRVVS